MASIHDLHIWSMTTTEVALTAHLVVPWATCSPNLLHDAALGLKQRFKIAHATIQLEPLDTAGCGRCVEDPS